MAKSYIDTCVEAVQTIDTDSLSALQVGPRIGSRGSEFAMRTLGKVGVLGDEVHAGLKLPDPAPDPGWWVERRMLQELGAIELLLEHMPELSQAVPRFLALLSVDRREPKAILTEDASSGGAIPLRPFSVIGESDLAVSIEEAFAAVNGTEVSKDTINYSLAFTAGERQRLLDFTPSPVCYTDESNDERIDERIDELIHGSRALVVDVSSQSELGASLLEHFKQ